MIRCLHIRAYTFEDTGVGQFLDFEYICMGCIACLVSGVTSSAERNTAACTNARIIMHICKGRDRQRTFLVVIFYLTYSG